MFHLILEWKNRYFIWVDFDFTVIISTINNTQAVVIFFHLHRNLDVAVIWGEWNKLLFGSPGEWIKLFTCQSYIIYYTFVELVYIINFAILNWLFFGRMVRYDW